MERTDYFRLVWASKLWLLIFAVAAGLVAYGVSSSKSDVYESKALGQIVSSGQASGEILSEEQLLSLSNLYDELAKTNTVLNLAHEDPSVEGHESEFDASVSVEPEAKVGVIGFVAETGDAETSASFANAYASAFSSYLEELEGTQRSTTLSPLLEKVAEVSAELEEVAPESAQATGLRLELEALQNRVAGETANPGDTMRVIERAIPGSSPVSPRPKRDALLAFIGALVLGALLVYLRDLIFDRYGSRDEVAKDLGIPTIGEIPPARRDSTHEPFRSLRAAVTLQLERAEPHGVHDPVSPARNGRSVLITGAESGCGKSFISSNLARALASEGRRVTIIDADLRRPTLHEAFDVPLSPGLSDLLLESGPPNIVGIGHSVANLETGSSGELRLVTAGDHTEEAVERLSSERMAAMVDLATDDSDVVVFDSPPTLAVVDAVVLARYATGVIFVVDSRRTKRRDARRSVEALRSMGVPLLGFVFNRSNNKQNRYDAYRSRSGNDPSTLGKEIRT
ncbi:MAG TPA: polysaccharide biosynthesis tyrosine autokinase [Solirubrobacterales bacterium]